MKAAQILVVAVAAAIAVYFAVNLASDTGKQVGQFAGTSSIVLDKRGDAVAQMQYQSDVEPEVKAYHDILAASVKKIDGAFLFTIDLAGDPNLNEKYETNYVWHIISDKTYTILMPNFAADSGFASKGWYLAVYDNTDSKYILEMTKISDMPQDRVQFPVDAQLIGNPASFSYWVSIHVRTDSKNLEKPPDYLMDFAP